MTLRRDFWDFLHDIAAACRSIIGFVKGMTLDAYLADEKTRYAVMRGYEIMGEAARHLPDELKAANPDIRWATRAAVRDRIVHGYSALTTRKHFATVEMELKSLLRSLKLWRAASVPDDNPEIATPGGRPARPV